jgi:hypothetical protein
MSLSEDIRLLASTPVDEPTWSKFVEAHTWPDGKPEKGRGLTLGKGKADKLQELWATDERVAPWQGTAWGVLQAANTYEHHHGVVRTGDGRLGRNMLKMVNGDWAKFDGGVLDTLAKVSG